MSPTCLKRDVLLLGAPRVSGDEPVEIDGEHGNGLSFLRDSRTFALSAGEFGIVSTNGRMELVKMVA